MALTATRTQTRYESAGLFVGPSPATGNHFVSGIFGQTGTFATGAAAHQGNALGNNLIRPLFRVQSFSDSFDNTIENVNQLGQATAIAKIANSAPTPTFDFTYFTNNGLNESILGFPVKFRNGTTNSNESGLFNCLSGILDGTQDSKNYFAQFVPEGNSQIGSAAADKNDFVISLSNGFITNYEVSASVGSFMESTVSVEGSNYVVYSDSTGNTSPAINPSDGTKITGWEFDLPTINQASTGAGGNSVTPVVIKQGGIKLNVDSLTGAFGVDLGRSNLNSFTVSVPVPRDPLERLGNDFVFARPVQTPVDGTVSFDFSATDFQTGALFDLFKGTTASEFDFSIVTSATTGFGTTKPVDTDVFAIVVRGATFESENNSLDIGSARNGSVTFQVPLGTKDETGKGIFFSGAVTADELNARYAGRTT
jgi:hypothetical protein